MKLACINCGSNIVYKIGTGEVYCDHCKSTTLINDLYEQLDKQLEYDSNEYTCSSCGAKIITIDNSLVNYCNFCGSTNFESHVAKTRFKNIEIIPFKYSKDDFIKRYEEYIAENRLSNIEFFKQGSVTEVLGLYIPASINKYDLHFDSKGLLKFEEKNDSGEKPNKELEYEYAANYKIDVFYDSVRKLPDYIISNLMPFGFSDSKKFSPYYIAGLSCPKVDDYEKDKLSSIAKSVSDILKKNASNNFHDIKEIDDISNELEFKSRDKVECYLPIWLCSYVYEGNIYSFAMNGQTGKIIYTLPKSKEKFDKDLKKRNIQNGIYVIRRNLEIALIAFIVFLIAIFKAKNSPIESFTPYIIIFICIITIMIVQSIFDVKDSADSSKRDMSEYLSNEETSKYHNFKMTKVRKRTKENFWARRKNR